MNRYIYTLLLYILLPFMPIKLVLRGIKQREYWQNWGERFGFYGFTNSFNKPLENYQVKLEQKPALKPVIWLHCVSVGETRAAEPLVKALLKHYPQHQIVLSNTTPTGRAASEALFGDTIMRVYLAYDIPCAVKRFLNHFKPVVGVLLETELWFNLIAGCKKRQLPLLLVNARMSQKSATSYHKIFNLVSEGLGNLTAIAAQTEQDAARIVSLGASQVSVLGNLKFDVLPPSNAIQQGANLRQLIGNHRPVFLAASTRANASDCEESLILQAVKNLDIPHLLTIIVPRHPQRFDEVAALLTQQGIVFERKSTLKKSLSPTCTVLLGDTMGEMFSYYSACDVAFIGGSLLALGGQNLIEACAVGKPVLIGLHTYNFASATEQAISQGAALRVQNSQDLTQQLKMLFNNRIQQQMMAASALAFSQQNQGASLRALELIAKNIPPIVSQALKLV